MIAPVKTPPKQIPFEYISIKEIHNRPIGDTRELDIDHVFSLAFSFQAIDLIQPLAIDQNQCLIAGGHRLWAMRVLHLETRGDAMNYFSRIARNRAGSKGFDKLNAALIPYIVYYSIVIRYP